MRALVTAVIYFGSFLALGFFVKRALDRWTARHGANLHDAQGEGGDQKHQGKRFLLGAWYD
jgi:hypothetical protein